MIVPQLSIPDDLGLAYQAEADERHCALQDILADRLYRASHLDVRGRYLIIQGPVRAKLEAILGGGHLLAPEELVNKVGRLARIQFGEHEIRLTPGQMEELAHRATKRGKPVAALIEEIWSRMQSEFFSYVR